MRARTYNFREQGAVSGYLIGVVLLAALLVGGLLLLKNSDVAKVDTNEVSVSSDTVESSSTTETLNESTTNSTASSDSESESSSTSAETSNASTSASTVAATGDTSTSDYTPESLTATGPEDFSEFIIGFLLVAGTVYMGWNYMLSRSVVNAALLKK